MVGIVFCIGFLGGSVNGCLWDCATLGTEDKGDGF
ncbi:hypothetical protein SYNPCC7002_D0029 (plasmid) [Picosynechococcus sp. PCC 7002]|nr:hypothetical protein SYNPCC7002_D0029 [Picosynechococcus sp. PCC 7002]